MTLHCVKSVPEKLSALSSRELSEVNVDGSSSRAKRLHSANSPSRLTPGSKKQKDNSNKNRNRKTSAKKHFLN